jgi:hypothetical protein
LLEITEIGEGKLSAPRRFRRLKSLHTDIDRNECLPHEMLNEQETTPIIFLQRKTKWTFARGR